jgi:non-canonical poly(A) RNA polymerase PAPD5/7
MAKIRTTFAGAHGILTAAAYMCAGVLGSRKNGRTHHFRRRYHPEDLSVLSSIVGVTQEVNSCEHALKSRLLNRRYFFR